MGFHNVDTSGIALDLSPHEISCLQVTLWNEQRFAKASRFVFVTYRSYGVVVSGARISVDKDSLLSVSSVSSSVSFSTPIKQMRGRGR
jgi:hypothetical protein